MHRASPAIVDCLQHCGSIKASGTWIIISLSTPVRAKWQCCGAFGAAFVMTLLFACATRTRHDRVATLAHPKSTEVRSGLVHTVFCRDVKPPVALKLLKNLQHEHVR